MQPRRPPPGAANRRQRDARAPADAPIAPVQRPWSRARAQRGPGRARHRAPRERAVAAAAARDPATGRLAPRAATAAPPASRELRAARPIRRRRPRSPAQPPRSQPPSPDSSGEHAARQLPASRRHRIVHRSPHHHPAESNPPVDSNPGAGDAAALGGRLEAGRRIGTAGDAARGEAVDAGAGEADVRPRVAIVAPIRAGDAGTGARRAGLATTRLPRFLRALAFRRDRRGAWGRAATGRSRLAAAGRAPEDCSRTVEPLASRVRCEPDSNAVSANAATNPAASVNTNAGRAAKPRRPVNPSGIAPRVALPAPDTDPIAAAPRAGGSRSP